MEIREIQGGPTQFTGVSVSKLRVARCDTRFHLTLTGADLDDEMASDVYHSQCIVNSAFKGFVFMVLTVTEDIVRTIGVPPPLLKYRLVFYNPSEHLDFALCLLVAYLENLHASACDVTFFVQVQSFLRYAWTRVTPMTKMRRFLCATNVWLLNTLMSMGSCSPFDGDRVLPHYAIYRHLCSTSGVCDVLLTLFEPDTRQVRDRTHGKGLVMLNRGIMNKAFRQTWISDTVYDWWTGEREKLIGEESLFNTYNI